MPRRRNQSNQTSQEQNQEIQGIPVLAEQPTQEDNHQPEQASEQAPDAAAPQQAPQPESPASLMEDASSVALSEEVRQATPEQETPTPVEEAIHPEPVAQSPSRNQLQLTVRIKDGIPGEDIVATADVELGNICTIRNVKLKQDDYGLKVVMPKTKMPQTNRFKDACYFHSPEVRAQFDNTVLLAYQQTLRQEASQSAAAEPAQDGMTGMTM